MMTKIFTIALFLTSIFILSQETYFNFPPDQQSYIGGNVQFYKDFNKILKVKNLSPCEDKNDIYQFNVLINPDNRINFVADNPDFDNSGSKCAKELSREVAKYLHGWNAATVDNKKVSAIASFTINPNKLFENFKEGYDGTIVETLAEFPGGINELRTRVADRVDLTKFTYDNAFRLEITFVVERDGQIGEVKLNQSSGLEEFDTMVLRAVSRIGKKWKPATIDGIPVRYRFRLPLTFQSPK